MVYINKTYLINNFSKGLHLWLNPIQIDGI